ncbi:porin [Falsiruegeria litorea]|uniref:porin n=1 Tax=Falsiruegeria litorea TaxID=1280831 RepID=UPI001BFDBFB4|nr:porin [Falsiruegeria litorea]MBT8170757.1 hypothetical protein [Falsiruegeria litorea]
MNTKLIAALVCAAPFVATAAQAQEFTWEGSLEFTHDNTFKSDDPTKEFGATGATLDLSAAYQFNETFGVFGALTGENLNDATPADKHFTDWGLYVKELGFTISTQHATFAVGKVSPVFGIAWDATAGYFASDLAEDYELTEQLGGLAEVELGDAGALHFGLFFADDTALGKSVGFRRPQNTTAAGGAGNTGKLNNGSVTWVKGFNDTEVRLGVRRLSAGIGDVKDETGVVASVQHSFANLPLDAFAEFAQFEGFEGTADKATYATLNAAYAIGEVTLSGTYALRDITNREKTEVLSIGAEYEFGERYLIGAALAQVKEGAVTDQVLGVNFEIALGS